MKARLQQFKQKAFGDGRCPCLLQKFVRFTSQRLCNANQAGQGKIVFTTLNTADVCPVHIRAFGERFLRQSHFFSMSAHVFCHPLAILVIHARQFWKKKARQNIDVDSIEFNTRRSRRSLMNSSLPFPKCHRKNLDGLGEREAKLFLGKMNSLTAIADANGGATSQRQFVKMVNYIPLNCWLSRLIIRAVLPAIPGQVALQLVAIRTQNFKFLPEVNPLKKL